ncbi:methyl-accepting chemotaxis protein [Aquaspirillum soli]
MQQPAFLRHASIATKLSLVAFLFLTIGSLVAGFYINRVGSTLLDQATVERLSIQNQQIVDMVESVAQVQNQTADQMAELLRDRYDDDFRLDTTQRIAVGTETAPALWSGHQLVNNDFSTVDSFTNTLAGAVVATIFVRDGDDLVRITTSLKKEDGLRAIGTKLDRQHPAYATLMKGEPFWGPALLFGRDYITHYHPLLDEQKQVIGALFVGLEFTQSLADLKKRIESVKVGDTGYAFAINARAGDKYGVAIIHPTQQNKSLLEVKDSRGFPLVQAMLERKQGVLTYGWTDQDGEREKIAAFAIAPTWNWLIGTSSYQDEFHQLSLQLTLRVFLVTGILTLIVGALIFWLAKQMVRQPLARANQIAAAIAQGQFDNRIDIQSRDETGELLAALDQMQSALRYAQQRRREMLHTASAVAETVQSSSEALEVATQQLIAASSQVAMVTERQASSLEEISASANEMSQGVAQNAERTQQAASISREAEQLASHSGLQMAALVEEIAMLASSSDRIRAIVGVMDGIAEQTNLLALNAAIEAARAGEAGRGFAVVADEVRALAQRSVDAAHQIDALITESTAKMADSKQRAAQVGVALQQVVTVVEQVHSLMGEIARANATHADGFINLNAALREIDATTQHNAAVAEETLAATKSLDDQTINLVKTAAKLQFSED